jgi:hypothetical protein
MSVGFIDGNQRHLSAAISPAVSLHQLWSWSAPWLFGAVLVLVALLGFWTASGADDGGTYLFGFAASGLALVLLLWTLSSGTTPQLRATADSDTLVIEISVLVVLAFGGVIGAALTDSVAIAGAGYGLAAASVGLIFWNLKQYFDRSEQSDDIYR